MNRFCKVLAVLVYLLGFIGGIVSCSAADGPGNGLSVGFVWFLALLGGTLFLILARVLEHLEEMNGSVRDNLYAIEELRDQVKVVRKAVGGEDDTPSAPEPIFRRVARRPDMWQCRKCQAMNASTELSCKECGSYR